MKKRNLNIAFAITLLLGVASYWLVMCLTAGENIETYYLNDFYDTSMDHFNMLANIKYGDPYIFHSNYPAMVFLLLKILFQIIPLEYIGLDGFGLREIMPAQLGYILLTLTTTIIVWEMLKGQFKERILEGYLVATALILSGPMIFAIERGNIIFLSFALLLIFISCYDSQKRNVRYVGYLALALSASLKVYPALFGILILQKKRYREAAITLILGALCFFVPFFFFNGMESIKAMLDGIMKGSALQGNFGMGYNFSFVNSVKIIWALFGRIITEVPGMIKIIPVLICSFLFISSKEDWKKMFSISLFFLWFPEFSYTYTLIFLIPSLIVYMKKEYIALNGFSYLYRILFFIILVPLALPSAAYMDFYDAKLPITWPTIIVNFALIIFAAAMILENILCRKEKGKS